MKKTAAKTLADKANARYIKEYYKNNPLPELFRQIQALAAQGLYSAEYSIPGKYHASVIVHLCDQLENKFGYKTEVEVNSKSNEYVLNINWA